MRYVTAKVFLNNIDQICLIRITRIVTVRDLYDSAFIDGFILYMDNDNILRGLPIIKTVKHSDIQEFNNDKEAMLWFKLNY
jgi:hypothetical protein